MEENKGKEYRKSWLHLRLTPSERAALQARAKREDRQVSDLARAALGALILGGSADRTETEATIGR